MKKPPDVYNLHLYGVASSSEDIACMSSTFHSQLSIWELLTRQCEHNDTLKPTGVIMNLCDFRHSASVCNGAGFLCL